LQDIDEFPASNVDAGSKYLAKKTFESLNDMFEASQEIQAWLTDSATVISKHMLQCVEWETPLGLKVLQPYIKKGLWIRPPEVEHEGRMIDCFIPKSYQVS
jgi:DNA-directed RNA polymerase